MSNSSLITNIPIRVISSGSTRLPIRIVPPSRGFGVPSPINTTPVTYPIIDKMVSPTRLVLDAEVPGWSGDKLKVEVVKLVVSSDEEEGGYNLRITHPKNKNPLPNDPRRQVFEDHETYTIKLTEDIKPSEATAVLKNGLLTITVPLAVSQP